LDGKEGLWTTAHQLFLPRRTTNLVELLLKGVTLASCQICSKPSSGRTEQLHFSIIWQLTREKWEHRSSERAAASKKTMNMTGGGKVVGHLFLTEVFILIHLSNSCDMVVADDRHLLVTRFKNGGSSSQ
jgi:hypothetical protein